MKVYIMGVLCVLTILLHSAISNNMKCLPGKPSFSDVTAHLIQSCHTPFRQDKFYCESAFDGDLTSQATPGFVNGWAYRGKNPTWAVFNLNAMGSFNTIIFKTGVGRHDYHLTEFNIKVLRGNKFVGIKGTRVNNVGATIQGSRVKINGIGQEEIRVSFDEMTSSAVQIHVYGSDASNGNSVITEIFILSLTDDNMNWQGDVDFILRQIPNLNIPDVTSHIIKSCNTPVTQLIFECENAFDGDFTSTIPGTTEIKGWAYGGNIPTWAVFNLNALHSFNAIIFKTAVGRNDGHHLNDFEIEVLTGNGYVGITGTRVNNFGAKIDGSKVKIIGIGQEEVRVYFDQITGSAVKIHAYGSDSSHGNSVVNEIYVLSLTDGNMKWCDDLQFILRKDSRTCNQI